MSRALATLLDGIGAEFLCGSTDRIVSSVTGDSRAVQSGSVFVATRGNDVDGHKFLGCAVDAGAAAVVGEDRSSLEACKAEVVVRVPDSRQALGHMLGIWYDRPDRDLEVVSVTGTNGKTTVAHLVRDLLRAAGKRCGLLGTIHWDSLDEDGPARLTTPGVEELIPLLDRMRRAGGDAVAMEASSHALDQQRMGELEVDFALFTNLSREHLDYHPDLDAYLEAKLHLLDFLDADGRGKARGVAVVNVDDPRFATVSWPEGTVRVGHSEGCDVRGIDAEFTLEGTVVRADYAGARITLRSRLLGGYNAQNLLLVAGFALASGMGADEFQLLVGELQPVPGRLEPVSLEGGPLGIVDYAHTPDGFEASLAAVRRMTGGKILLVFGCGGDRDRGKRPEMAAAASAGADRVYLTLDNPRHEEPEQIFADVEAGFPAGDRNWKRIVDRQKAITAAVLDAEPGDVVLVAGKGHETSQKIGDEVLPWDDRQALVAAWAAREATR